MMIFDEFGLIIVGNSGVGKSFLANLILDKSVFAHEFSARSVTHQTDSIVHRLGERSYRIYNIPGLIEGNEQRIVLNRKENERAFEEQKNNPIVILYVFGHQHGRIRHEDVTTFQVMHKAYRFSPDSLLVIVNGLPADRPNNYNEDTQKTLYHLLNMELDHVHFIDRLDATQGQRRNVRQSLIDTILRVQPSIHKKVNNVELIQDGVVHLRDNLARMRIEGEKGQREHGDTILCLEQNYEAAQRLGGKRIFSHPQRKDRSACFSVTTFILSSQS